MDRAEQWLHRHHGNDLDGTSPRALAGLEALAAAGALTAEAAARWRERLTDDAPAEAVPDVDAEPYLAELLHAVGPDEELAVVRMQAAIELLAAVGAADAREWDAKLRERAGWPSAEAERALELELNAGATEVDLLGLIPGDGHPLLVGMRFADGVSFIVETTPSDDDWPEWTLADDVGTDYWDHGVGGDDRTAHISFSPAVPEGATWLELTLDGVSMRVTL